MPSLKQQVDIVVVTEIATKRSRRPVTRLVSAIHHEEYAPSSLMGRAGNGVGFGGRPWWRTTLLVQIIPIPQRSFPKGKLRLR